MDGQKFDEIAKALATRTSRRRVIRLLATGAAAGLTAVFSGRQRPVAARRSAVCDDGLQECYQAVNRAFAIDMRGCAFDPQPNICRNAARRQRDFGVNACRRRHCTCPAGTTQCSDISVGLCCEPHEACELLIPVPIPGVPSPARCVARCGSCETWDGAACHSDCGPCEVCEDGACVPKVCGHSCDQCDPATGTCEPLLCGPCEVCVNGSCQPQCMGCAFCFEGACREGCPSCQACQDGACVPVECPPCHSCFGGDCVPDCGPCETCDGAGGCVPISCPAGQAPNPDNGCTCACIPVTCPGAQVQNPATCACECSSGLTECNGACVDTNADPANCGGCGTACAEGQTCTGGTCSCPAGASGCCPEGAFWCGGWDFCCQNDKQIVLPDGRMCCNDPAGNICRGCT